MNEQNKGIQVIGLRRLGDLSVTGQSRSPATCVDDVQAASRICDLLSRDDFIELPTTPVRIRY